MIHTLLQLFIYILIIDVVMSYFPQMRMYKWAQFIHKIADVPQKPIRDLLPNNMPIDPTPMILIFLIQILMYIL